MTLPLKLGGTVGGVSGFLLAFVLLYEEFMHRTTNKSDNTVC